MSLNKTQRKPLNKISSRTVLHGDVLEQLDRIPNNTVDLVVTSVPFWGVRNYNGAPGQWGLEKDVEVYLDRMRLLMQQLRRILKRTGSAWIEIGDKRTKQNDSWMGIPEEFFVNTKRQGWKVINRPVWFKRNGFPLSSRKMFSPKFSQWYGFGCTADYFFDIKRGLIPAVTKAKPFNYRVREAKSDKLDKKYGKGKYKASKLEIQQHDSAGRRKQDHTPGSNGKPLSHYAGFNDRYDHNKIVKSGKHQPDFFDVTVKSLKGMDHYATFPVELIAPILKCACPDNGMVLDPFIGSGTTGLAAELQKLNWIGVELEIKYIEFIKSRLGVRIAVA